MIIQMALLVFNIIVRLISPLKRRYKITMMERKQLGCCWSKQESQIILYTRICSIITLSLYSARILLSMYEEVATAVSGRRALLYVVRLD